MPSMLVTVKISKGFKVWTDMAKSLEKEAGEQGANCLLYTSPSPRDGLLSRMPSSA